MNRITIIGNVGQVPDVRDINGTLAARISVATTEKGYTRQDGTTVPDNTDWHNVTYWGKMAELVQKYVSKGDKVCVEGSMHYKQYKDKAGVDKTAAVITGRSIEFLSSKQQQPQQAATLPAQQPQPAQQVQQPQQAPSYMQATITHLDDLPF